MSASIKSPRSRKLADKVIPWSIWIASSLVTEDAGDALPDDNADGLSLVGEHIVNCICKLDGFNGEGAVPPDLSGLLGDHFQPFRFRSRLDAARRFRVLLGTGRFLSSLALGKVEGHSKHCKFAHGLSLASLRCGLS